MYESQHCILAIFMHASSTFCDIGLKTLTKFTTMTHDILICIMNSDAGYASLHYERHNGIITV